jgi:hypothetical protein
MFPPFAVRDPYMALALVLFVSMFCAPPPVAGLLSVQQSSDTQPADSTAPQNQATPPSADKPAQPSAPAQSQTPSGQNPPAKHPPRKKKPVRPDCGTLPAAGATQPSSGASSAGSPSSAAQSAATSSAAPAPGSQPPASAAPANAATSGGANAAMDCPPPKKVVRQGGVPDPHIQLAGGPGGKQASQEQADANQMVAATEENLKTIAGRELSSNQKDVVSQIQQFVQQSKAAATAGDLDRALTLAKKAQLLSEELAKPPDK